MAPAKEESNTMEKNSKLKLKFYCPMPSRRDIEMRSRRDSLSPIAEENAHNADDGIGTASTSTDPSAANSPLTYKQPRGEKVQQQGNSGTAPKNPPGCIKPLGRAQSLALLAKHGAHLDTLIHTSVDIITRLTTLRDEINHALGPEFKVRRQDVATQTPSYDDTAIPTTTTTTHPAIN